MVFFDSVSASASSSALKMFSVKEDETLAKFNAFMIRCIKEHNFLHFIFHSLLHFSFYTNALCYRYLLVGRHPRQIHDKLITKYKPPLKKPKFDNKKMQPLSMGSVLFSFTSLKFTGNMKQLIAPSDT